MNSFPQFREEKEKSEKIFSTPEKGKRKVILRSSLKRRKRNLTNYISIYERRKRNLKFYSLILRVEKV